MREYTQSEVTKREKLESKMKEEIESRDKQLSEVQISLASASET